MFQNLSDRLGQTLKNISGKGRITEDNIKDTLREVRMALLEADVALPVIKDFVARIKERSVGIEVSRSLNPGQMLIKIVQGELETIMGSENEGLNLAATPPAVILMDGLHGAGKTTSVGKLAKYWKESDKKKGEGERERKKKREREGEKREERGEKREERKEERDGERG